MRIVILAIPLLIIDWFAFRAVDTVLVGIQPGIQGLIANGFWSIPALSLLFVFSAVNGWITKWPRVLTMSITAMIFILYLSKLFMGIVVALDDVRRGIAWVIGNVLPESGFTNARLTVMSQIGVALGLIPLLSLTYGLLRNPYRYKVFRREILLPDIPSTLDGLRIVQISDIHTGSLLLKNRVARSAEIINSLEPDLVFFTGDLVNNSADEADAFIDVFRQIKTRYGVYSIVGNHDYGDYTRWPSMQAKQENFEKLKEQHRKLGWDLLLNDHRRLDINGSTVGVVGVENYSAHPRFQKYGDMAIATKGMGDTDLTILLSHDPSHWDDEILKHYRGIDLTLSGHTHGFQFGFELTEDIKWSPVQYVYKRWAGLYKEGSQYLYVNRGLGFLGYPGRVGILPEITLLTIRKQEKQ